MQYTKKEIVYYEINCVQLKIYTQYFVIRINDLRPQKICYKIKIANLRRAQK